MSDEQENRTSLREFRANLLRLAAPGKPEICPEAGGEAFLSCAELRAIVAVTSWRDRKMASSVPTPSKRRTRRSVRGWQGRDRESPTALKIAAFAPMAGASVASR